MNLIIIAAGILAAYWITWPMRVEDDSRLGNRRAQDGGAVPGDDGNGSGSGCTPRGPCA